MPVKSLKEIKAEKAGEPHLPGKLTVTLYQPVYQVEGNPMLIQDCFLYETIEEAKHARFGERKVIGVVTVMVEVLS